MTQPRRSEWHAAIHEAGHAVVATIIGYPFEYVTIVGDNESGGKIKLKRGHARRSDKRRNYETTLAIFRLER
jgi:ATP-dependent Zn protease